MNKLDEDAQRLNYTYLEFLAKLFGNQAKDIENSKKKKTLLGK